VTVLHIVPHLPPPYEGVGTYAVALAAALGGEARFLVGDPGWSGDGGRAVGARSAEELLAGIGDVETVLLHYASYGYQRRGCPAWLAEGLTRWRGRLVTVFHEVWASGPPWRSSFWLLPAQRRLAARLARRSEALATTLEIYAGLLRPWTGGKTVAILPVFSTVGEPAEVPGFAGRAPRLVVFGGAGVRSRTWGRFLPELARAVEALAIEEVLDVGPSIPVPAELAGVPVRPLGVLPVGEVSGLLLGAAAGFLAYPPDFLPKSTIFAAYCAHGVLPVCAWDRHPAERVPYWTGEGDPAAAAAAARGWYAGHSLERQAARFREMLAA
jgi:hypothetical protein